MISGAPGSTTTVRSRSRGSGLTRVVQEEVVVRAMDVAQGQPDGRVEHGPADDGRRVAGHDRGRQRQHQVVHAVRGDQLAQQRRAALAHDRARAVLAQVPRTAGT